jgi:hypothetical protein
MEHIQNEINVAGGLLVGTELNTTLINKISLNFMLLNYAVCGMYFSCVKLCLVNFFSLILFTLFSFSLVE